MCLKQNCTLCLILFIYAAEYNDGIHSSIVRNTLHKRLVHVMDNEVPKIMKYPKLNLELDHSFYERICLNIIDDEK